MSTETVSNHNSLAKWRHEIDRLDDELLRLVNRRAAIACELGAIKVACGLPAYDGRRERQVLARVRARNQGPLAGESVASIFHRIILETRRIGIESMREQRRKSSAASRLSKEHRNGH